MSRTMLTTPAASQSGVFRIGGERPVARLGFGAMRITGPGIWGPPRDHDEAIRVLRRAVALGVTFSDTADSYGRMSATSSSVRLCIHTRATS
jgi:pyridoxine 4-dehydrogenase